MELQPDDGLRSSLGIGVGSDDTVRKITEGLEKLAGNKPGDHRKMTIRLAVRILEAVGLGGRFGLHPKKIDSERQCASRRRTRKWT
ncbi:hypothetical protein B296_00025950 [Ensete ventricosum]|uniref:Uncharacterized protein n=1 Tax=Ensete ventricosum TaxID=4639 RepID=A0A426YBL6_ENSVE|nr:hypothetical protein B296_00025950 [Ensete ventricosum]